MFFVIVIGHSHGHSLGHGRWSWSLPTVLVMVFNVWNWLEVPKIAFFSQSVSQQGQVRIELPLAGQLKIIKIETLLTPLFQHIIVKETVSSSLNFDKKICKSESEGTCVKQLHFWNTLLLLSSLLLSFHFKYKWMRYASIVTILKLFFSVSFHFLQFFLA